MAMLLVKSISLGVAEQASQGRVEEALLEGDVRASLPIEALTAGLRRQKVATPEMFGNLVQPASKDGVVFPESLEEV